MSDLIIRQDLRARLDPVPEQGRRPTCLAFATSACHQMAHGQNAPFSVEWLFYHAVQRNGGDPEAGCSPSAAVAAVEQDGQPFEHAWPYQAQQIEPWRPASDPGDIFRAEATHPSLDFASIIAAIEQGRPVVLGLFIGMTFHSPARICSHARILDDPSPPDPSSGHAVLAVGVGAIGGEDLLLIRNSWGAKWGAEGHAWLGKFYWQQRALAAFSLKARP